MRCLALQHVAFEDLGLFARVLSARGFEIVHRETAIDGLDEALWDDADLVVVLGGPIGVGDVAAYPWLQTTITALRRRLHTGRRTLGVCLGAQLMAAALGARVQPGPAKEIGWSPLTLSDEGRRSPLRHLGGLPVLHWHGDRFELPPGATPLASTGSTPHQAFSLGTHALALQFHPEVDATRIERWLIGHAVELAQAGVDVSELRHATRLHAPALAPAAAAMLDEWLAGGLSRP